ncbi:MAG: hypothetical protein HS111_33965 [Kofleriaceae bacterium]|nr:hypothetical protein [Kofleriaceae bacterium]
MTDATASGQIAEDAEVARCVACVLGTVRFPPPADGATVVTYPLLFSGR